MSDVKRLNKTARDPNIVLTNEREIGDVNKGFAEADRIIEYIIRRAVNSPAGVEAQCIIAQWRGDFLDIYAHHQWNPMGNLSPRAMSVEIFNRPSLLGPK
jgi:hypothetical protein